MDRLRRIILRDCPIPNAGPCPKTKAVTSPPAVSKCPEVSRVPCQCPEIPSVPCQCPEVKCPVIVQKLVQTTTKSTTSTTTSTSTASTCQQELVECEKSLGFSGTAKDGAQRSRSAIQKDLERLQEDFDKLNFTRYHFENESIDLAKEVRSCQTAKGECEEAKKDADKGWRQTNITLVKVKKDVANLTSLWNTCLTEKGEQEGYADDLQGNLTICLGDLTTSKTAETTNEQIITELKENIKGKKSIQGVKF